VPLGDAAGTTLLFESGVFAWDVKKQKRVNTDSWRHIATVVSKDAAKIFVDGEMVSGMSVLATSLSGPVHIGEGFIGVMDEAMIHDRALTEAEIKQLAARRSSDEEEREAVYRILASKLFPNSLP